MRFSQYKHINDLFDSVKEAVDYMINEDTSELCGVCADSLNAIYRIITSEKKYIKTENEIKELFYLFVAEEYKCEKTDLLLNSIKESLKNEIRYRLKVLFVAELSSKWDSMSSVYAAFKSKADCDVDVVMEPIFRAVKLEDGTERKDIIYEDYLTPLGIKFYTYDKYDISKELPDITVISQPYESVTVSDFWPENIAKYSKLVYLPYYTALLLNKENSVAYDSFFELNTQKYSWKIACQSEKMRKAYMMYASERGKNVIVTGLPKWDYSLSLNKENTPCPKEWEKKIKGKKVFLLNTHFNTESINELFTQEGINFFKSIINRKDIAVIWRPHPMTMSIIKVYVPHYLEAYNELIALFDKSTNLIYDNKKSYDYSFVWSDALISLQFPSSIISQYLLKNKPLAMIAFGEVQKNNIYYEYDKELFDFTKIKLIKGSEKILEFMQKISSGNDEDKTIRQELIDKYFPLSDGKSGDRFADKLIESFEKEFGIQDEQSSDNIKVLVVGEENNSRLCIENLKKKNIKFDVSDMFRGLSDDICTKVHSESYAKYNYIIITERNNASDIKEYIVRNYDGVNCENIIIFWDMYDGFDIDSVCDRVMNQSRDSDGVLLGTARSLNSIINEKLNISLCDFSNSKMTLDKQFNILTRCIEKYPERIKNWKYAFIDMFDYDYFNITSDPEDNCIDNDVSLWWNNTFGEVYEFIETNNSIKYNVGTVSDQMIRSYNYSRTSAVTVNKELISNNITVFEKIILELKRINSDIKIISYVIPGYWEAEMKDYRKKEYHRSYFDEALSSAVDLYNITYVDFKEKTDLSASKNYYSDAMKLNYFGAVELTECINRLLLSL